MDKELIIFGVNLINNCKFYYPENPIQRDRVDIDKILMFKKVSLGKNGYKQFIGDKNN